MKPLRATAWIGAALFLAGSASVATATAAAASAPGHAAAVASASKTPLNSALSSFVPHGASKCVAQSSSLFPPGMVGVAASIYCALPKLGTSGGFYSYAFNNGSDYAKSLAAYNAFKLIYPSVAGNVCPISIATDFGSVPWHSSNFPPRGGQVLECIMIPTGKSTGAVPDYIWTVPSKHVFLEAVGNPGSTMRHLSAWWKADSVNGAKARSTATHASGPPHASTLVALAPRGTADCVAQDRSNLPAGLVGLVQATYCVLPKLGAKSSYYAYVFDNATDYAVSVAAYNKYKTLDPATADDACPMAAGFTQGAVKWDNGSFPSRSDQILECIMVDEPTVGPGLVPDYVWTVPTKNVLLEAAGDPGSTMQSLDAWWTANSDT
jgi:hypothetical protein